MTDSKNISLEERDLRYAERLAEMIRCRTVSKKDGFEAEEFLKLRQVIETLFPRMTEAAERTILGDDAYLYKIKGKDERRNVMVMSHHDVVEAKGTWKEKAFGGTIRDGKLWGRGTVDTKTPLFAEFTAIEELLEEGFAFPVNVYLFSSHNEETGGDAPRARLLQREEDHLRLDHRRGRRGDRSAHGGDRQKMRDDGRARKGKMHRAAQRKESPRPRGTRRRT